MDDFIELVGEKNYKTFAYTMQIKSLNEVKNGKNEVIAHSLEGALKGLQGLREAIILRDSSGNIWAATIIADPKIEEDKGQLHYFTNVKIKETKLPEYMDEWRQRFGDVAIVFASKNQDPIVSKE